jgi:hypothetical protein
MKTKSGEVLIAGALIGLVCGLIGMWVDASGRAQAKANLSGMEVSVMDEVAEEPGRAAIWTLGGAGAGAGIGALVDGLQGGSDKGNDSSVRIEAGGDVQYIGRDGEQDQGNKPTTTTTTTENPAPVPVTP